MLRGPAAARSAGLCCLSVAGTAKEAATTASPPRHPGRRARGCRGAAAQAGAGRVQAGTPGRQGVGRVRGVRPALEPKPRR